MTIETALKIVINCAVLSLDETDEIEWEAVRQVKREFNLTDTSVTKELDN